MSERLTVKSELFTEVDADDQNSDNATCNTVDAVTYFKFQRNVSSCENTRTEDDVLKIEHSKCTIIDLVGLQVWRGALLLADFILHLNCQLFRGKHVLELGSGVGLCSIMAAIYAHHVLCTDINVNCILKTIKKNIQNNKRLLKCRIDVEEIDFSKRDWSGDLQSLINSADIVLAADVIYDHDITEHFVATLVKIINAPSKLAYISLEKRYVFTIADLDVVAPCYDYFMSHLKSTIQDLSLNWKIEEIEVNFPQYFNYDRNKELVLLKISWAD